MQGRTCWLFQSVKRMGFGAMAVSAPLSQLSARKPCQAMGMSDSIVGPGGLESDNAWLQTIEQSELTTRGPQRDADAVVLAMLWRTREKWINRSIEQISFSETSRMHRTLTLDVEIPWDHLDSRFEDKWQSAPVPVLLSARAADLLAISVKDSSGRLLPIRSLSEAVLVGAGALKLMVHSSNPKPHVSDQESKTPSDRDETTVETKFHAGWPDEAEALAQALSQRQLILVDFPRSEAPRDLLRIEWEETISPAGRQLWIPPKSGVAIKAAAVASSSRHISVDAPLGLEISGLEFRPPSNAVDVAIPDAQQYPETTAIDGGELLLALRPTRRAALQLFGPPLAVVGLSVALLATSTLSSAQAAAAALLLLVPAALTNYPGRSSSIGSWIGWDIEGILIGVTSFVAASALALEVNQVALDIFLSLAALAGAAASVAAASLVSRARLTRGSRVGGDRIFESYSAQPSRAPAPTDAEVEAAVDELIQSTLSTEESGHSRDIETLQERASEMATEQSYVEVSRPDLPDLTGQLVDDVLCLTRIDPEELATYLDMSAGPLVKRSADNELSDIDHQKLAGVRAAALVLYGGLDSTGVRAWLTLGAEPPLKKIARGDIQDLQRRLDDYVSSPAE
jgi:hypothetical protein